MEAWNWTSDLQHEKDGEVPESLSEQLCSWGRSTGEGQRQVPSSLRRRGWLRRTVATVLGPPRALSPQHRQGCQEALAHVSGGALCVCSLGAHGPGERTKRALSQTGQWVGGQSSPSAPGGSAWLLKKNKEEKKREMRVCSELETSGL